MRDEDLIELAKKLGEEIDALPKDGKEHEISITVGGSNSGNISVGGTQIVINPKTRELTWADLESSDLRKYLAQWKAQAWSGYRGYWLNVPCFLILVLGAGLVWSIFTGVLPIVSAAEGFPWLPVLVIGAMVTLMLWLMNIRRIEGLHIQKCQAVINEIQAELRMRRGC